MDTTTRPQQTPTETAIATMLLIVEGIGKEGAAHSRTTMQRKRQPPGRTITKSTQARHPPACLFAWRGLPCGSGGFRGHNSYQFGKATGQNRHATQKTATRPQRTETQKARPPIERSRKTTTHDITANGGQTNGKTTTTSGTTTTRKREGQSATTRC